MNIDYMSKKQAVLCSSEAFGEKFVIPAEEVEFAPRRRDLRFILLQATRS
jgi:hypothetical protein